MIRIRVGATADRSIDAVFGGIEKRALKARDNINKALGGSGGGPIEKSMDAADRASKRAADSIDRTWNAELARLNKLAREQDRLHARVEANKVKTSEAAARQRVKIEEKAARDIEKATREAQRRAERSERERASASAALDRQRSRAMYQQHREAEDTRRRFAERTSWRATKFLVPPPVGALGHGQRLVGGLLRGAGVDFSLQSSVQRGVSLSSQAIQLANQERIANNGQTRGAAYYENLARTTAGSTASDSASVMSMASKFAARTGTYGNLDQITPQLASLARASGANFEDVGSAAGMVFQQLRSEPDAIKKTIEVMRSVIGQSAEGAVDMPDYASQLGRVAAGAFKFEGDRGRNISALSALTQIAMERGATSAADAARSTGSFVSTLGKGARLAEFEKAGVRIYNDDTLDKSGKVVAGEKRTTLRPLEEIIKDSFRATGGNIPQLGRMYMDVLGRKGIESLGSEYQAAGGGEAGIKAIEAVFDRYMKATLTTQTEQQNLGDVRGSTEGRAKAFQERYDAVIAKMTVEVLPALEQLADPTIKLANTFASVAKFAADMPVTFGGLVVAAAVLRAGLESWARAALERRIMGLPAGTPFVPGGGAAGTAGGPGGMGGVFTGGGGYSGARGVLNSPAGAMVATMGAAYAIDLANDQNSKLAQENGGMGIGDLLWESISTGKGLFDAYDQKQNAEAQARRVAADAEALVAKPGGGDGQGKNTPALSAEELQNALAGANAKGIRITNLAELKGMIQAAGPAVSPAGRSPAPGP